MANADNLQTITSISFLPKKVVSKVLARVTVSSSIDLFRAKICCKVFSEVSEEKYIYQCVSLDKVDYFIGKNLESALECLEEAAKSGHDEAAYALGIIFLFGGDNLKWKGMTLLSAMKKSRIQKRRVKHCRDNLPRILKMIWVKNSLVLSQRSICCAMQHNRKRSWLMDEIDEEESTCEGCACAEEIAPICDALAQFHL
ncbi:uncharacterized protein LOC113771175 [Coffea eugenioides]|uniref:uncharacterized protein LOC113771175 n=1 Tax=Coffea eugenioides TaxID=49369 RepID=UPI000F60FB25|nr:uncharacterized protein LOC113771175 [Coffea eugenioides]